MKSKLIPLAISVSVACATAVFGIGSPAAFAAEPTAKQTAKAASRAEAKAERDEFLKTHEWVAEHWELKGGGPYKSGKARADVLAERDAFLKENRWDPQKEEWVSIKAKPREVSKLPRDQVKSEALEFHRTHEWNEATGKYIERKLPLRAK
ncbi:MAG: hypothetical protein M0P95_17230 [Sulfuritalea sp.]|nr:hypothetical protein [Sulfuritalea sp.]